MEDQKWWPCRRGIAPRKLSCKRQHWPRGGAGRRRRNHSPTRMGWAVPGVEEPQHARVHTSLHGELGEIRTHVTVWLRVTAWGERSQRAEVVPGAWAVNDFSPAWRLQKPANNAPRRAAEWVKGRAVTKGNSRPRGTPLPIEQPGARVPDVDACTASPPLGHSWWSNAACRHVPKVRTGLG